ncbi:hypothetical protein KL86APRO_11118 [uncultured Alphaproteobacteria bacterium]|uniref:Tyr recombinase domain-containing protein n=1 Tax=uncultured Alphaproteobacteria bacterium TaxID=91750 RepID=A0A212JI84_9PROT|nr:hypothetical protein KL86APRO_11118 [uncultured Alphaproteobacteria bacterium]
MRRVPAPAGIRLRVLRILCGAKFRCIPTDATDRRRRPVPTPRQPEPLGIDHVKTVAPMDILIVDHRHGADGAGNVRPHDLRHTFASDYLQNGGRIARLQAILGHGRIERTMEYAHHSTFTRTWSV